MKLEADFSHLKGVCDSLAEPPQLHDSCDLPSTVCVTRIPRNSRRTTNSKISPNAISHLFVLNRLNIYRLPSLTI
jgi:hypothetical protein